MHYIVALSGIALLNLLGTSIDFAFWIYCSIIKLFARDILDNPMTQCKKCHVNNDNIVYLFRYSWVSNNVGVGIIWGLELFPVYINRSVGIIEDGKTKILTVMFLWPIIIIIIIIITTILVIDGKRSFICVK